MSYIATCQLSHSTITGTGHTEQGAKAEIEKKLFESELPSGTYKIHVQRKDGGKLENNKNQDWYSITI